jgi:hypothetical protein
MLKRTFLSLSAAMTAAVLSSTVVAFAQTVVPSVDATGA